VSGGDLGEAPDGGVERGDEADAGDAGAVGGEKSGMRPQAGRR
jgi:hypothetical protein